MSSFEGLLDLGDSFFFIFIKRDLPLRLMGLSILGGMDLSFRLGDVFTGGS